MNKKAWAEFCAERERYRNSVENLSAALPELKRWQKKLVKNRGGPSYQIETPVVYNTALDEVSAADEIKLILVADNPGRREQAEENRRYLVGPSGKIAARFFRERPELGIDFYHNVLILNKTPIHTPRTAELAELCKLGGEKMKALLCESQKDMAESLLAFHNIFAPVPVWIIGYSEMKKGGLFEEYTNRLKTLCLQNPKRREEIFFFRHFSMNQFTIDLKKQKHSSESCGEALRRIGTAYRERILGRCTVCKNGDAE